MAYLLIVCNMHLIFLNKRKYLIDHNHAVSTSAQNTRGGTYRVGRGTNIPGTATHSGGPIDL